ncbi:MAG: hypothetical protein SPL22_06810 [Treponema sp.]|uniref:hypothetical protein n=1 Tax=Treponema sp. TaxID=166 RepID=UPI002A90EA08|nr:hypothetical protein [Treponema sp.]MDY6397427.1 hypothetical protein [Treponema sp.]
MKNCNSKIQKILALLLSVMFIFVSCSDIFSGREETGSVTFSLSPELIQAVSNACRAADDDVASSDKPTATEQEGEKKDGKYKFEIEIGGKGYNNSDFRSADDLEKLEGEVFHFDNIPVGAKIYVEAKISAVEENLYWRGKSEEKVIEAGENTLSFNLRQVARCKVYNNTESAETDVSDIESIEIYALKKDSEIADKILKLVAQDDDDNDYEIFSTLKDSKALVYKYENPDSLSLSGEFELITGFEGYFLSLVTTKDGVVYLGHPEVDGTDADLKEKALTKIAFNETNYIYLSLMEMKLFKKVVVRFRFENDDGKYEELKDSFPDKTFENNKDFDKKFEEHAYSAKELGYIIDMEKSDSYPKKEEGLADDTGVIYVYFNKLKLIDIRLEFYFQNEEGKYVENNEFPPLTLNKTYLESKEFNQAVTQYTLAIVGRGYDINDEKTDADEPELVDGVYVVKFYFDKAIHGPVPFSISLKPTSGANVPEISKVHSVTLYAVDATNAKNLQTALASSEPSKAATDIINILEKHEETMAKEVTYLQSYSSEVLKAKTSPIVIEDSFTTWGAMGKGKSLAIVAVVNYGDGKDIDAFCIGCSSVIEASAESNVVAFDYNPISVPCTISFCLNEEFAEDYTISTALSSFTPSKNATFLSAVMAVAADTVEALKEKEYTYSEYYYGESSGIPYVTLYFVKDEPKPTVKEMVLSGAPETIYVGESKSFGAKYVYSDGSEKAAESFHLGKTSDLVEVSDVKDGKITITGKTPGNVTFTVLSDECEGIAATFTVTVEATSTSSGIKVTLAETSTTDEGENVTLEFEETSDGLDFTATPKTGTTVTNYMWIIEGLTPESGNEGGANYNIPASKYEELGFGVHHVTCVVTIDGEDYSVNTTFTLTAE